jgi:hypothetical protein
MEATGSSETSVEFQRTVRRYIQEVRTLINWRLFTIFNLRIMISIQRKVILTFDPDEGSIFFPKRL